MVSIVARVVQLIVYCTYIRGLSGLKLLGGGGGGGEKRISRYINGPPWRPKGVGAESDS